MRTASASGSGWLHTHGNLRAHWQCPEPAPFVGNHRTVAAVRPHLPASCYGVGEHLPVPTSLETGPFAGACDSEVSTVDRISEAVRPRDSRPATRAETRARTGAASPPPAVPALSTPLTPPQQRGSGARGGLPGEPAPRRPGIAPPFPSCVLRSLASQHAVFDGHALARPPSGVVLALPPGTRGRSAGERVPYARVP